MNWTKTPWNRVLKNGLVVSSPDKDADLEDYTFKDHTDDKGTMIGGVDIIRYSDKPPFNRWVVEFWGRYKEFQFMFIEKHDVDYENMESAQIAVDAFLDKIFDLKVFL